jgi:hypothetical protein
VTIKLVEAAAAAHQKKEERKAKTLELEANGVRVIDPKAPFKVAKAVIAEFFWREGVRTLHHHRDVFYRWNGSCYLVDRL